MEATNGRVTNSSAVRPGPPVFTTGALSRICKVAPRTISKWIDSGRLKGYRIPLSEDRRVEKADLIAFLKAHKMPLGDLEEQETFRVLLVGFGDDLLGRLLPLVGEDGFRVREAGTVFDAGLLVATLKPQAVVVDLSVGRAEAVQVASSIRRAEGAPPEARDARKGRPVKRDGPAPALLVALAGEDCGDAEADALRGAGYAAVYVRPFDPALLAELLRARKGA